MRVGIPFWMLLTALLTGCVLAGLLYLWNRKAHYGKPLTVILFVLRALMGATVVLLLFNPYISQKLKQVEQPAIVVAHDNSASVVLGKDSAFYKSEYPDRFRVFLEGIKKEFQIDSYLFGQQVSDFDTLAFDEQLTDMSSVLQSIERKYYKRNAGAVVLLSDGLYNRGFAPDYIAEHFPFSIYSVVLGDTAAYPDLLVKDVQYNRRVAVGAAFPVRVLVGANDCRNTKAVLRLSEKGKTIESREIMVRSNRFSQEVDFMLTADHPGVRQIEIEITGLDDEMQRLNNTKRVFIDVTDRKYRILCLGHAPHPDVSALKSVLNDNYEVDAVFGNDAIPDLDGYDLLVLHQVPSENKDAAEIFKGLEQHPKLPVFFIIGSASQVEVISKLQQVFELHGGVTNTMLDVRPFANTSFSTFTFGAMSAERVAQFPPLALPHIEINAMQPHDDMLLQEVLGKKTGLPLLSFASDRRKMAFLFGTNIWRWRLYDFRQSKSHAVFDELCSKTFNYLLTDADDGFTVICPETFLSNERVIIHAELRNQSGEWVTDPDVEIRITNKMDSANYDCTFARRDRDYELDAGLLPEGVYSYEAKCKLGDKEMKASGSFAVAPVGVEAQQLTASADFMRVLAATTGGRCYNVDQLDRLAEDLRNNANIASVEHHETRFEDLIHTRWLFFMLLGLAAVEWLLRKMFGSY